ncbi:hypothetical protein CACET_c29500 [Clostridium aceticum]|uniref:Uncharacterized protein n=1 Tax=Clostridium aceticum TaxID=84022 RepID=A0A0D8I9K8_9CLOT|nr:hypothetical protein [Clostridium aceticum]AKL96394.1 hypothetical protein CACET_c29500 [Clostridium aceticum]KJF26970.1 hypothetical protein TZ02_10620 [Clostridium aceticum]
MIKTMEKKLCMPNFPGVIETKSFLKGRVRFYVPLIVGNPQNADIINTQMVKLKGIIAVETNTISGSVLINYNEEEIPPTIVFGVVIKLLGLEEELERIPQPILTKEINNIASALNHAIYDYSKGLVDLWSGVPMLLGILGIRQVLRSQATLPGGITLLWWSYSHLMSRREKQHV